MRLEPSPIRLQDDHLTAGPPIHIPISQVNKNLIKACHLPVQMILKIAMLSLHLYSMAEIFRPTAPTTVAQPVEWLAIDARLG